MLDFLSDRPVLQEKDKLVNDVMRYVLFKTHQASGCPIKREELTGIITKNYRQRGLPTLIINEARDRLAATFGYEMRELQRTRAPSTRFGRASEPQRKASSYFFLLPIFFGCFHCVCRHSITGRRWLMNFCARCI